MQSTWLHIAERQVASIATHVRVRAYVAYPCIMCIMLFCVGCRIEPPLKLAENNGVVFKLGDVVTDLDVIWDTEVDWQARWYYGWDEEDQRQWGEIEYPEPTNYEGRFYYFGEDAGNTQHISLDRMTIHDKVFHRRFDYGYHDILVWSNIDSPDGTQTLIIDESDEVEVHASTSRSRLSYAFPPSRSRDVYNIPEVFYAGTLDKLYVSRNVEDYDYFDEALNMWVKESHTKLYPLVYMYLVQVVIHHNKGRVLGTADDVAIDNVADGVNVRSGHTSQHPVVVAFPMRMKRDRPVRGAKADVMGSKLTTFGLCDMQPWSKGRGTAYDGSRTDLSNRLSLCLAFSNSTDSVYMYDVTQQMQRQAHGGIITIEIDADTLRIPRPGSTSIGAAFDPTIAERDSISHEFEM